MEDTESAEAAAQLLIVSAKENNHMTDETDDVMSAFAADEQHMSGDTEPIAQESVSLETLIETPIGESKAATSGIVCTGCKQTINERYLLSAMDVFWHEDCLKCSCCGCRLGEVGSSLYTRANLLLCKRDYLRLFGATGQCAICAQTIPGFEMVMKVKTNVYHVECFKCQQCRQRFCVGDKFYLCEGRVLCEYDFEEQNLITSIQRGYNALTHMKKHTSSTNLNYTKTNMH